MFGRDISCISCENYAGRLADGYLMCMENGPQTDITYCDMFKEKKENSEKDDIALKRTVSFSCENCCFYKKEKIESYGECKKFPGKKYDGGKRNACAFFLDA